MDFESDWKLIRPGFVKLYKGQRLNSGLSMGASDRSKVLVEVYFKFPHPGSLLQWVQPLKPRLDLLNKSPSGFEWGYTGSGPAQLAFALLLDFLGESEIARVLSLYQEFKRLVVVQFDDSWALTEDLIQETIDKIEQKTA